MNYLLKPLVCFHIYGNFCCKNLYQSFINNYFDKKFLIYNSENLFDANTIFLWGNFNPQLTTLIKAQSIILPINNVFVHIQGRCHTNNNELSTNLTYKQCYFNEQEINTIIKDIKKCFKK